MKESKLELQARTMAERAGWIVYKGHGRNGSPDKIFTKGTYVFFVEFKNPNGKGRQSSEQKLEQELLEKNGSYYHLCNNLEDFRTILLQHHNRSKNDE